MIAAKEKAKKLRKKVKDDEMAEEDITVDTNAEKSRKTPRKAQLREMSFSHCLFCWFLQLPNLEPSYGTSRGA